MSLCSQTTHTNTQRTTTLGVEVKRSRLVTGMNVACLGLARGLVTQPRGEKAGFAVSFYVLSYAISSNHKTSLWWDMWVTLKACHPTHFEFTNCLVTTIRTIQISLDQLDHTALRHPCVNKGSVWSHLPQSRLDHWASLHALNSTRHFQCHYVCGCWALVSLSEP